MGLRRHHLFILIVSLILVVAFIFPEQQRWSIDAEDIPKGSSHIWIVDDIDDIPGDIVSNDCLYIKKVMDKAFSTKYATILPDTLKIFKKNPNGTEELILENPRIVLIKSTSDDTTQEYYFMSRGSSFYPELLPVGDLIIRYRVERKFNGTITEQLNLEHLLTVLPLRDPHIPQLEQGDDSSL